MNIDCAKEFCKKLVVVVGGQFCEEHSCHISGCINESNENAEYCVIHKCEFTGCASQCQPNCRACSEHLCNSQKCGEVIMKGEKYCRKHKCNVCYRHVVNSSKYCKIHSCIKCGHWNKPYSTCCAIHTCSFDECVITDINEFGLCESHSCKYVHNGSKCGGATIYGYCSKHCCAYPRCPEKKTEGTESCAKHKCVILGCLGVMVEYFDICDKHKCKANKYCKIPVQTGMNTCGKHKCQYGSCDALVSGGHLYDTNCDKHLCIKCSSLPAIYPHTYCYHHKCVFTNCGNESQNYGICANHVCQWGVSACIGTIESNKKYCIRHMCKRRGCNDYVLQIHSDNYGMLAKYCVRHSCHQSTCLNMTYMDYNWCSIHLSENAHRWMRFITSGYYGVFANDIKEIIKKYVIMPVEPR